MFVNWSALAEKIAKTCDIFCRTLYIISHMKIPSHQQSFLTCSFFQALHITFLCNHLVRLITCYYVLIKFSTSAWYVVTWWMCVFRSDNGVVNIYDMSSCLQSKCPQPLKSILNLTTACTSLEFNATDEVLAAASNMQEKAVKLVLTSVTFNLLSIFISFATIDHMVFVINNL